MIKKIHIYFIVSLSILSLSFECTGINLGHSLSFTNDGVVIKSYMIKPQTIYQGGNIDIFLTIQNVGTYKTTVTPYIFGPSWLSCSLSSVTLNAADPVNNVPGGITTLHCSSSANPNIPQGMKETYTIYARLCYPYRTDYLTKITVNSKNEFMITNKQVYQSSGEQVGAPIKISIYSVPAFLKNNKLTIYFLISNAGNGFPFIGDCEPSPAYQNVDTISSFSATSDIGSLTCSPNHNIKLINGKAYVECTLNINLEDMPKKEITIHAIAQYKYMTQEKKSITIIGE